MSDSIEKLGIRVLEETERANRAERERDAALDRERQKDRQIADLREEMEGLVEASEQVIYGSHGNAYLPGQMKRFLRAAHRAKAALAKANQSEPTEGTPEDSHDDDR